MLETVIRDHNIGGRIGLEQHADGVAAVARHKDRRIGGPLDKRRFIARLLCRHCWHNFERLTCAPAKAARHDAHLKTLGAQMSHQCNHQWGFASATDHDVAHHNHWNRKALRFK